MDILVKRSLVTYTYGNEVLILVLFGILIISSLSIVLLASIAEFKSFEKHGRLLKIAIFINKYKALYGILLFVLLFGTIFAGRMYYNEPTGFYRYEIDMETSDISISELYEEYDIVKQEDNILIIKDKDATGW